MRTGITIRSMLPALLALCLVCGVVSATAQEPPKVALLIGNQKYDASVGELKNPHNDIKVVGDALSKQGFTLLPVVRDARRSAILGAVRELARRLSTAGTGAVGFLYYSGHGAAESDTNINYLIPVDAREPGSSAFWDDSVKLDDIIRLLDGARSAAKFIVFDACRNELRMPTKSSTKGFVPVPEQQGMFIAYASAAGRTASDVGAESGPYAAALATELSKPGLDHLSLFQNVKEAVFTKTGGVQQPWESNGLFRRVYLTGRPGPQPAPPAVQQQLSEALQTWMMIRDNSNVSILEAYAKQFGDTVYGAMAKARIDDLKKQQVAVAVPPPTNPPAPAATAYPTGPVNMVVPFAPGGPTDIMGRIVGDAMSKGLGQPVVIVSRPGAGGTIGSSEVAKGKPDGGQVLLGTVATHAIAPNKALTPSPPYDPARDFEPVILLGSISPVLAVRRDLPTATTLQQFVQHAKANPGKLTFGSGGAGTASHLACAMLNSAVGIEAVHVPYRGTAPAINDLVGGHIDYVCEAVIILNAQLQAGSIKALAILDDKRSPSQPDVATMSELGFPVTAATWNALFVARGTPGHVVGRLHEAALQALHDPGVQSALGRGGWTLPTQSQTSPGFLARYVRTEIDKWGAAIKASGIAK
jgi:tripartite-type tricarboxylate transporter receptor subunit TctC